MYHFNFETFNSLPEVERAWSALSSSEDYETTINKIGEIICDAGLNDILCLNLIHRHATLQEDEIMLRRPSDMHPEGVATVTEIRKTNDFKDRVPLWWRVRNENGLVETEALEFSAEKSVLENFERVTGQPSVLEKIHRMILESQLERLIGVRILAAGERKIDLENETFLETIVAEPSYQAILEKVPQAGLEGKSLLGTSWQFFRDKDSYKPGEGEITAYCYSVCWARCVWLSPGHSIQHGPGHCNQSRYV